MGDLGTVIGTPEKLLIAAGTASLIIAIVAPGNLPFFGKVEWPSWKQGLLGVVGAALLIAGASLNWLPLNLFFPQVDRPIDAPSIAAGPACEVLKSSGDTQPATIDFVNTTQGKVKLFWIDQQCALRWYFDLEAGYHLEQPTYVGHRWLATDMDRLPLAIFVGSRSQQTVVIKN